MELLKPSKFSLRKSSLTDLSNVWDLARSNMRVYSKRRCWKQCCEKVNAVTYYLHYKTGLRTFSDIEVILSRRESKCAGVRVVWWVSLLSHGEFYLATRQPRYDTIPSERRCIYLLAYSKMRVLNPLWKGTLVQGSSSRKRLQKVSEDWKYEQKHNVDHDSRRSSHGEGICTYFGLTMRILSISSVPIIYSKLERREENIGEKRAKQERSPKKRE